jgi:hypothetical protein
MFDLFSGSVRLFLQGKLFRDNAAVFRSWAIGFAMALVIISVLAVYVNLWAGAVVGGLISSASMPHLFRNLKYN